MKAFTHTLLAKRDFSGNFFADSLISYFDILTCHYVSLHSVTNVLRTDPIFQAEKFVKAAQVNQNNSPVEKHELSFYDSTQASLMFNLMHT